MMYYTHIATSVAVTSVGATLISGSVDIGLLAGVTVGAILPDIDEPNSKIGRKFPIISHIVKFLFNHRGITHSLPAALVFAILMGVMTWQIGTSIFMGLALGYLLHILEDFFFGKGVPLFKPFSNKRYWFIGLKVGGIAEKLIFLIMVYLIIDVFFLNKLFAI